MNYALILLAALSRGQSLPPARIVFKGLDPYLSIDGYTVPLTIHGPSSGISLGDGRILIVERDFTYSRTHGNTSVLTIRKASKISASLDLLAEFNTWFQQEEFWQKYPNSDWDRSIQLRMKSLHAFVPTISEVVKKRKNSLIATVQYLAPWSGAPQRAELVRVHFFPLRVDYICPLGFPVNYNPAYTSSPRVYRTEAGTFVLENNNLRSLRADDRPGGIFSTVIGEPVQLMQGRWLVSRRLSDAYFACYVLDVKTRKTRLVFKGKMDRLDNLTGWPESHYLKFWRVNDVGVDGHTEDAPSSEECVLDVTTGKVTKLPNQVDRFVGGFGIASNEKRVNIYSLDSGKLVKSLPIR